MYRLTVTDYENVYDAGTAKVNSTHKIHFSLPEEFAIAKGTCGCTASKLDKDELDVVYLPKTDEANTVARKTIKLTRADGSTVMLQFNVTVQ